MTIKQITTQPEGRRLEFKELLPENADLANTIIAFANDVGGELYIGIRNNPREITGLPEDDLVKIEEITSSGLLPPSIDYAAMESRQSDARNKVIAPVFKRMGIIDQWGNGLKLIANELKEYPQIEFRWKETGLSFQVQFVKLNYLTGQEQQELGLDLGQELGLELGLDLGLELQRESNNLTMYSEVLSKIVDTPLSRKEISEAFGQKQTSGRLNRTLVKLIEDKLIEHTIPEKKNHPEQKFKITKRGIIFLELLKK